MPRIDALSAAADRFTEAAATSLFQRTHLAPADAGPDPMAGASCAEIAAHALMYAGAPPHQFAPPEEVALKFLQLGSGVREFSSSAPAYNRPGDTPNLLSNLAGKILDRALELSTATFPHWTKRLSDVPDFKPKTVIQAGTVEELDLVLDDEEAKPARLREELGGWIAADRYANSAGLTPIMWANDDLSAFAEQIESLAYAHDNTLNNLCVSLLTGNVALADGVALFHDGSHINDVADGGVPSATEMTKMRNKHALQPGVGGIGLIRTPPAIALVPQNLSEQAEQTFLAAGVLLEAMLKRAATDSAINVHRGKILPVVEPALDAASTAMWYTFANPKLRAVICHVYQTGYGPGGRRTTWFDPARETRFVKLEGRFGAAATSHRGAVRNSGVAEE